MNNDILDTLFRKARTYNSWLSKPVPDELLRELYEIAKLAPTSANSCPARFVLLRSETTKERLCSALATGNVEKTMKAPVTVIIAYNLKFYEKLPELFPHDSAMRDIFANNPQLIEETAKRNSSLRSAYLILAPRALGLDCGPMSGFDNAKVDEELFAVGKCEPLLRNSGWIRRFRPILSYNSAAPAPLV